VPGIISITEKTNNINKKQAFLCTFSVAPCQAKRTPFWIFIRILFDLRFREKKSTIDKCAFALWKNLKALKKKYINKNKLAPKKNHGFHQWDTIAEGLYTIHIPCYNESE